MPKFAVELELAFISTFSDTIEADNADDAAEMTAEICRNLSPDDPRLCPERIEADADNANVREVDDEGQDPSSSS